MSVITNSLPGTESRRDALRPSRLLWLDLFRGLAVFGMFDAHLTNAVVQSPDPLTGIYYYHDKLFNLPAPAFLFAAGISFGMSLSGRWSDYRRWSPVLRGRLVRLLEILLLGLLLHLPFFSLGRIVYDASERQLVIFRSMDVLQCIAVAAFLLLALVWLLPRSEWFLRSSIAMTAGISVASPAVWNLAPQLPWWLGTYVSKYWGSFFPLFPYAGFLFAGAAWGSLHAREQSSEAAATRFLHSSARYGLWLMLAGVVAALLPLPAPYDDFWNASPQFFVIRVGFFSAVLSLLIHAESKVAAAAPFLVPLGKESLVIYIAHLMIIYGSLANPKMNLSRMLGKELGVWEWLAIYALLTLAMTVFAKLWTALKARLGWRVNRIEWAVAALLAVVFVVR